MRAPRAEVRAGETSGRETTGIVDVSRGGVRNRDCWSAFAQADASSASAVASTGHEREHPAVTIPTIRPAAQAIRPLAAGARARKHARQVHRRGGRPARVGLDRRRSGPTPEHQVLDEAAVAALSRCPFHAGTDESGQPAGAHITVTYHGCWTPRGRSDHATLIGITRPRSAGPAFVAASPPRPCHWSSSTRHCARPVARLPSFTWP